MAKFTDKQVLQLLIERINEMTASLNDGSTGSADLDLFDAGRRHVLDSLSYALDFYSQYEFD